MAVDITNDLIQKLAYQRGMLSLLKVSEWEQPLVDQAIQDMERILDKLSQKTNNGQ